MHSNFFLYLASSFIWGTTWIVITFQLGVVSPELSVAYRFLIASAILISYCAIKGHRLRYNITQHGWMALQGLLLFSVNYFLTYLATFYLTTGLVAVIFSMLLLMNVLTGSILFRSPILPRVVIGGTIGLIGIGCVFSKDLATLSLSSDTTRGLLLSLAAMVIASFGTQTSVRNQKNGLPVLQTNAFGMGYSALFMFLCAVARGDPFVFDPSFSYVSALLYLSLFGSILAFGAYLTLVGRIGADRAAYVNILYPIVALIVSTIFENYHWNAMSLVGVLLILFGNVIVLRSEFRFQKLSAEAPSLS